MLFWTDNWLPNGAPINARFDEVERLHIEKVADLLVPGVRWNKQLVEWIFCPATAVRILVVPLSIHGGQDVLYWTGSSDGEFIQRLVASSTPTVSTEQSMAAALWRKSWKSSALPRCKDISWRALNGILLVRAALRRRGVDVEDSCPFCGMEEEMMDHLFMECEVSCCCWFGSSLGMRVQ